MKHTHLIEADSAEEFKAEVASLHAMLSGSDSRSSGSTSALGGNNAHVESKRGHVATGKPPGRPPKEKPTEAAVEAEATDDDLLGTSEEETEAKTWTLPEVKAKFQTVIAKIGVPKAKKLINKFGVPKANDLKDEQFAEFVSDCEQALK